MYKIKNQYDPELRKNIQKKNHIAILPIGSIEQHGPHLPISTDSKLVTEVAEEVSKKCRCFILPTIQYGVSFEHAPFFQISLKKNTLKAIIRDIASSLENNGIKTLVIINGHYSNQEHIQDVISNSKTTKSKIKIYGFSYWHFMQDDFDHAGEIETSLMLATTNQVKMNKAVKGLITKDLSIKEKKKVSKDAAKCFPETTKNGIWGDPINATEEKGRRILSIIVKNLSKKVSNLPHR